jgi:hypothetical protein
MANRKGTPFPAPGPISGRVHPFSIPRRETPPPPESTVTDSADQFAIQLEEWGTFVEQDINNIVENAALKFEAAVINNSPADSGAYIASHGIANGSNPGSVEKGTGLSESEGGIAVLNGVLAAQKAIEKAQSWHWDGVSEIVFYNNQPYAEIIEYGGYPLDPVQGSYVKREKRFVIKSRGGYSAQAPQGVYTLASVELSEILEEEILKHGGNWSFDIGGGE